MKTISPFLWFNNQAEEAVQFYTSIFSDSSTGKIQRYEEEGASVSGQQAGSVMTVDFTLEGQHFTALNGGPSFHFTPGTSFSVHCGSVKAVQELWKKLIDGGTEMMPCQEYPFSKQYGWLADKFGVSWQLNCDERAQKITPSLMFTQGMFGKAEEAINVYTSLFPNSKIEAIARYEEGEGDEVGKVKYSMFQLNGTDFTIMESSGPHEFTMSQAVSFIVPCKDQQEIDTYWEALGTGGEFQPCGWLLDKYGVAWQIIPENLDALLSPSDPEKAKRALKAMFGMKKMVIKEMEEA